MFCWHDWDKWQEYEAKVTPKTNMELMYLSLILDGVKSPDAYTVMWQKRTCKKCGKTQRERV